MTCAFAHNDAAYVLGALSPAERLAYERHLPTCEECSRSVRALAGMPGLLGLADASVLEHPPSDPPVPATLLPSLTRAVQTRRRRRTLAVSGLAAAAAAVMALGIPVVVGGEGEPPVSGPGTSSPSDRAETEVETAEMAPQGDVPIAASLAIEKVRWGTRMLLTCTYDKDWVSVELPDQVDYLLFVTTKGGRTEQVGSWTSVSGTTMTVPAATSVVREDIATVEVRTTSGRVVLRLDA